LVVPLGKNNISYDDNLSLDAERRDEKQYFKGKITYQKWDWPTNKYLPSMVM
jgi:hypothetical protein